MSCPLTLTKPDLWRKIETFEIDDGKPSLTFAARLARENGSGIGFASRVVHEYKKFVYLAMVAGHRVTPSEHVDQAWHLHMVYTDSYWDRLCGEVLPRPLSHTPTKGGEMEDSKFDDWYAKTKESYERQFGWRPPSDIWPDSATRFGHDLHWRRVNTQDNWVVPKRAGLGLAASGVAVPAGMLMTASGSTASNNAAPAIVMGVLLLGFAAAIALAAVCRRGGHRRDRNHASGGCGGVWWFGGGCGSSGRDHADGGDSAGSGDGAADGGDGGDGGGCGGGGCGGGGCGGGD